MLGTRYISAVGVRSCQLNVCVSWKFVEIGPSSRLGLVSVHIHWPHNREKRCTLEVGRHERMLTRFRVARGPARGKDGMTDQRESLCDQARTDEARRAPSHRRGNRAQPRPMRRASSSESLIARTPSAMCASTTHRGSDPSSSAPTYIDTCDHLDCVRRLTSSAQRVLPALSSTSPRRSTLASACRSAVVSIENSSTGFAR